MTALTIYGVLGDDLWIDRDGKVIDFNTTENGNLHNLIRKVVTLGATMHAGLAWTLTDVIELSLRAIGAPELDPCTRCRTLPILHGGDHCIECARLVQEQSDATMRTWRAS